MKQPRNISFRSCRIREAKVLERRLKCWRKPLGSGWSRRRPRGWDSKKEKAPIFLKAPPTKRQREEELIYPMYLARPSPPLIDRPFAILEKRRTSLVVVLSVVGLVLFFSSISDFSRKEKTRRVPSKGLAFCGSASSSVRCERSLENHLTTPQRVFNPTVVKSSTFRVQSAIGFIPFFFFVFFGAAGQWKPRWFSRYRRRQRETRLHVPLCQSSYAFYREINY